MELLKSTQKPEKENNYDFEKQKDIAIKQFEKFYSNTKQKSATEEKEPKKIKAKFKKNKIPNFMDIFFKDQDKTLIILLIVMLMDKEENFMIIMALFYLIV